MTRAPWGYGGRDAFKEIEGGSARRAYNVGVFAAHLIGHFCLSLAVLKPLDLLEAGGGEGGGGGGGGGLGARASLMVRACLSALLVDASDEVLLRAVFSRLGGGADAAALRDGLARFIKM